jgi:uncharacterized protein
MSHKYTNELIKSSSPYLLQHAHNPVNWQPWDDGFQKNDNEKDKLLIISIGYAACHWCHVMEHESFEDENVAKIMNENFICIKVDREERPDVDHYYMTAVHLMGLQGGWPLNVIALPDGKPIWGGTYFPKKTWINNITAVANFWHENRVKALEYANNLHSGIEETGVPVIPENPPPVSREIIDKSVSNWKKLFDFENGGRNGYPKFPMPVNLDFLLYYGVIKNDAQVLGFVQLTLQKMGFGGIYDQAGGGFARYSTDEKWKVPHFEKMLYDNGLLLGTYARAYQQFKLEEFRKVVFETARFLEQEMMTESGAFYSSLDADSEGEEGKFYTWSKQELNILLNDDYNLFSLYFNIDQKGLWEKGQYILLREMSDEDFAARNDLTLSELNQKVSHWKNILMQQRSKRIRPSLDDKTLSSWNAMVIQGLTDAYKAFGEDYFLKIAVKNATFIEQNMIDSEGKLFHSWKNGQNAVSGFLDDYAFVIQAYISLFEVTGNSKWLQLALQLFNFTFIHFYDEVSGLFFYSPKDPKPAVSNHFQNEDNVIPSANSIMANNLHKLFLLYGDPGYMEKAEKMLQHIMPLFEKYPYAFANWGTLMLKLTGDYYEIVIAGENAEDNLIKMNSQYKPNVLWAITSNQSNIPLLKGRFKPGETLIYLCRNGSCRLPVKNVQEALSQMERI